ncbi:MAG: hypothetical protein ACKV0T_10010 [Planctomycetales bacterium]
MDQGDLVAVQPFEISALLPTAYLRSSQPIINKLAAAIQLPATRTTVRRQPWSFFTAKAATRLTAAKTASSPRLSQLDSCFIERG